MTGIDEKIRAKKIHCRPCGNSHAEAYNDGIETAIRVKNEAKPDQPDQATLCPLVVDRLIGACEKMKEWMENQFSDTDFDLDGCMAEVHAEFSIALYDVRKYYREPAPLMRESVTPIPEDEWHEGYGAVLWWRFPVQEPPYCGTPLDGADWTEDYYTHFTPLTIPREPSTHVEGGHS